MNQIRLNLLGCATLVFLITGNCIGQTSPIPTPFGQVKWPNDDSFFYNVPNNGNNARSVIDELNRNSMKAMGYTPPPTQADIAAQQQRWLNAKPPELTPDQQRMAELKQVLNEVAKINHSIRKPTYYETPVFKEDFKNYKGAQSILKDMLTGQKAMNLADAIYSEEASFGNLQLTYREYKKTIAQSAAYIKEWMSERSLSLNNPEAIHYAIQSFMGDSLHINSNDLPGVGVVPHSHKPFMYDYIDFRARDDYRNYFLTKTLATGAGQCHTLPLVYLVLAEAMGVQAYLSVAPQHTFIKYLNNDGTIQNYEPTVHWHMTNQDYMEAMPITPESARNRVYLDTLNKQQIIAVVMIELANNFLKEHWIGDGKFVIECIDFSEQFFPNRNFDQILLLRNLLLTSKLEKALTDAKIKDLSQINTNPRAAKIYAEYRESELNIERAGIQNYPESAYNAMLEKHDKKGKLQAAKGIDTKTKRTLFFN